MQCAVALTTLKWNLGGTGILAAMETVGLENDQKSVDYFESEDAGRLSRAQERRGIDWCRKRKEKAAEKKKGEAEMRKEASYKSGGF